ncbi:MAG: diacylglycerol kinase family protein [Sphingomonas sp.]|uniref:diacylglycerol/lipid kinase family protein n=1 Tax=Sphingomonas sp. TaxID=28214 RepID=UPI0035689BA4
MSTSPLPVLVNRKGGTAASAGEDLEHTLIDAFAAAGTNIAVRLLDGPDMPDVVRKAAATSRRVVVGGGDGTAACAAAILADSDVEMGLLPLGTLNHLARDLGIPATLEEAAALAASGTATSIDLAEVNGHVFANNASIGLYPMMVRRRDAYRERLGVPKWLAAIPASWSAWTRLRRYRLSLDMGEGQRPLVTSLLFVGNNRYSLERGQIGERASLKQGKLSVFALAAPGRFALLWFALRAVAGRADHHKDFVEYGECESLTVHAHRTRVDVGLDGEVQELEFPLHFRIRAGALRIVAPPEKSLAERPA